MGHFIDFWAIFWGSKLATSLDLNQKGLEVCYYLWGVPSRPSPGSYPGPVQVPSRVRGGPVQIRHVLCFTAFRTHPGPEVGTIPARPGPILLPSVPCRVRPGGAETDFLAFSDFKVHFWRFGFRGFPALRSRRHSKGPPATRNHYNRLGSQTGAY